MSIYRRIWWFCLLIKEFDKFWSVFNYEFENIQIALILLFFILLYKDLKNFFHHFINKFDEFSSKMYKFDDISSFLLIPYSCLKPSRPGVFLHLESWLFNFKQAYLILTEYTNVSVYMLLNLNRIGW